MSSLLSNRCSSMQSAARSSLSVASLNPERLSDKAPHTVLPPVNVSRRRRQSKVATHVYAPLRSKEQTAAPTELRDSQLENPWGGQESLLSKTELLQLEHELSRGDGIKALVDFNNALRQLTQSNWGTPVSNAGGSASSVLESKLQAVFREWCFNLESFNPAFAAVLLQVQLSIGESDYYRRDDCLRNLIQPLAGEYGMHNNESQAAVIGKTHRQLFKDFYESLFPQASMSGLLDPVPVHAKVLFQKMLKDIQSHGVDSVERASYALGYNLAMEYLADYEKRWMLHSFQQLASDVIQRDIDWVFLEIHAEDEKEHAEIGHEAVLSFVPRSHLPLLKKAMADHDRDFAIFYNELTRLLTQ